MLRITLTLEKGEKLMLEQHILQYCDIVHPNASQLSPEEFTNLRRCGIGASDASILLGLQAKWRLPESVIEDKLRTTVSDDEKEIGNKPAVRKGRDLEPLVLDKAAERLGVEIIKPTAMYRLKEHPVLTVNYDGVTDYKGTITVVEAKTVTAFGDKNYKRSNALKNIDADIEMLQFITNKDSWMQRSIETKANACGVPAYYYAQVQQQLLGIHAPFGFLAALHDKDWTLEIYYIPRDLTTQTMIVCEGMKAWNKIAPTN